MSINRDLVKELQASPHFVGIPSNVLHAVSVPCEPVRWRKDTVVARRGDPVDQLILLTKGEVEVLRRGPDGAEAVTSTLGPGMFLCVAELIDHAPAGATYRVKAGAQGVSFSEKAAWRLLGDRRPPGAAMRRALTLSLSGQLLAANNFLRRVVTDDTDEHDALRGVSGILDGG